VKPAVSNLSELYVAPGGPLLRILQRVGLARIGGMPIERRIVALILLTWVPMCVLAIVQGDALGPTPRQAFLLDFPSYARFFIGIPLLTLADARIGRRLAEAGRRFVSDGLVREADYPVFEAAVARLARRRESVLATLVIIALAVFGAWQLTQDRLLGTNALSWQTIVHQEGEKLHFSLAGLWNNVVAVPVTLFLAYRWLWRILIWTLFLRNVARMDLDLIPTHADSAGGLGFLEQAHMSFGIIGFGFCSVLAAGAAFRLLYEGATLETFRTPGIVALLLMQVIFVGPLLVFFPLQVRARRAGLAAYGALVADYNRRFHRKWIERKESGDEILGTGDIQSLADLGNSYRFVREMRPVPFSPRLILGIAAACALPALPLPLFSIPLADLVAILAKFVV
jgi:hypothetical protein